MTELLLILGIALIFFGPSRLPGLGKSMGQAIRGFKKGLETSEDETDGDPSRKEQIPTASESATAEAKDKSKHEG